MKNPLNARPKTDREPLPSRAPTDFSADEKKAYAVLHDLVSRAVYAERCDHQTLILAATRLATVWRLRRDAAEVRKTGKWFLNLNSGGVKTHPIANELRLSEAALSDSLGALYLSPRARANARGIGELEPNIPQHLGTDGKPSSVSLR